MFVHIYIYIYIYIYTSILLSIYLSIYLYIYQSITEVMSNSAHCSKLDVRFVIEYTIKVLQGAVSDESTAADIF